MERDDGALDDLLRAEKCFTGFSAVAGGGDRKMLQISGAQAAENRRVPSRIQQASAQHRVADNAAVKKGGHRAGGLFAAGARCSDWQNTGGQPFPPTQGGG